MSLLQKLKLLTLLKRMNFSLLSSRKIWALVLVAALNSVGQSLGVSAEHIASASQVLTALILGLGISDAWRTAALSAWQKVSSKRLWVSALSVALITLGQELGLSPEAAQWVAHAATAYIGASTLTRLTTPLSRQ